MKQYKVSNWRLSIEEVDVVRETEKQVVILDRRGMESREAKSSSYSVYLKTYNDAVAYHINRIEKKIESLNNQIKRELAELAKAKELLNQEPTKQKQP